MLAQPCPKFVRACEELRLPPSSPERSPRHRGTARQGSYLQQSAPHICRELHLRSRYQEPATSFVATPYEPSSYCLRCRAFARHALMIRVFSPLSAWHRTRRLPLFETPSRYDRNSPTEWSGSGTVIDCQSANAVAASSKDTPCRLTFAAAFRGSHSKSTSGVYATIAARFHLR